MSDKPAALHVKSRVNASQADRATALFRTSRAHTHIYGKSYLNAFFYFYVL